MLMTKEVLSEFAELIRENKCNPYSGNLKTGFGNSQYCDCCHRRR